MEVTVRAKNYPSVTPTRRLHFLGRAPNALSTGQHMVPPQGQFASRRCNVFCDVRFMCYNRELSFVCDIRFGIQDLVFAIADSTCRDIFCNHSTRAAILRNRKFNTRRGFMLQLSNSESECHTYVFAGAN